MRLIYTSDPAREVRVGDTIILNDSTVVVVSFPPPPSPASSGKVTVRDLSGNLSTFYVFVIGAEWVDREDRRGTCPVCEGTRRMPAFGRWAAMCDGYDFATHTFPCTNCGGQKMFGTPTGVVPLRLDGTPCRHEYERIAHDSRRCYSMFKCKHCGDTYDIDTGD